MLCMSSVCFDITFCSISSSYMGSASVHLKNMKGKLAYTELDDLNLCLSRYQTDNEVVMVSYTMATA